MQAKYVSAPYTDVNKIDSLLEYFSLIALNF
jgi:hypothetical protein